MVIFMKVKHRRFLSKKEIKKLLSKITYEDLRSFIEKAGSVEFALLDNDNGIISIDGTPSIIVLDPDFNKIIPHLAAIVYKKICVNLPYVVIDRGALPHILNGADVMRPGVVKISEDIEKDQIVLIKEIDKKIPIALGIALFDSKEIKNMSKGKIIKTLHYFKDNFWNIGKQLMTK